MESMESTARGLSAAVVLVAAVPVQALAYVGPGAGLSALGTVVALIGAFFLMIVGFVWYPIKRVLRARKKMAATDKAEATKAERPKAQPTEAELSDAQE